MNQAQIQSQIDIDPENQKMATEITAIILEHLMKSGWKFWANPFFWVSVGRAMWPVLKKLYIKIFKTTIP